MQRKIPPSAHSKFIYTVKNSIKPEHKFKIFLSLRGVSNDTNIVWWHADA